jgi:predicted TIM-barrel fold metal-dependent hydrolase
MIIDAHTHLLPASVVKNRRSFFRRDEAFRLLYENEKARLARPEDFLEVMDREGVHRSVICGFPWEDPALCREGNDFLWECQARYPGRFLPLACFSLRSLREAEKERDRCLTKGFPGIGELAFYRGGLSSEKIRRLTAVLNPLRGKGVPVLLHTHEPVGHEYPGKSGGALLPVFRLLQALPDVTFVLAHWGGGFFFYELMPEVARAAAGVFYDTAASPFLYRPLIYSLALKIVGPGRILFGSDYPLLSPKRYFSEMAEARLPAPIRARIQGLNARRLFLENQSMVSRGEIGYNDPDFRPKPAG